MRVKGLVGLDIETSGLDPKRDCVLAVAVYGAGTKCVLASKDEADLLRQIESVVSSLPEGTTIATWNGEEFDLPFLARRFAKNRVQTALRTRPTGRKGKYGGKAYEADWARHQHIDVAPLYRSFAQVHGVNWNLKPIARAVLGREPIEVDRRGVAILTLKSSGLRDYVLSDATITYELAGRALEAGVGSLRPILREAPVGTQPRQTRSMQIKPE